MNLVAAHGIGWLSRQQGWPPFHPRKTLRVTRQATAAMDDKFLEKWGVLKCEPSLPLTRAGQRDPCRKGQAACSA
jgi:hypothetical protein